MPPWIERWNGDGIISRASTPESARKVVQTGIPTVDLNDQVRDTGLPQVHADHAAIARLAAEHLLERGFRHFAFFGFPVFEWSVRRQGAFAQRIRDAGCRLHDGPDIQPVSWGHQQASWEQEIESVARWIGRLPKPLGVMAGNDIRGMQLLDACRLAGVAVPEEVAVVGVDNEELVCQLAYPPLSSVVPDAKRIGYVAAERLDRMMKGEAAEERLTLIPPVNVVVRQSSDVTAIADPRSPRPSGSFASTPAGGSAWTTCSRRCRSRAPSYSGSSARTCGRPSSTRSSRSASSGSGTARGSPSSRSRRSPIGPGSPTRSTSRPASGSTRGRPRAPTGASARPVPSRRRPERVPGAPGSGLVKLVSTEGSGSRIVRALVKTRCGPWAGISCERGEALKVLRSYDQ